MDESFFKIKIYLVALTCEFGVRFIITEYQFVMKHHCLEKMLDISSNDKNICRFLLNAYVSCKVGLL